VTSLSQAGLMSTIWTSKQRSRLSIPRISGRRHAKPDES